jgi:hypothetical protein
MYASSRGRKPQESKHAQGQTPDRSPPSTNQGWNARMQKSCREMLIQVELWGPFQFTFCMIKAPVVFENLPGTRQLQSLISESSTPPKP